MPNIWKGEWMWSKRGGMIWWWLMGISLAAAWFAPQPAMAAEIPVRISSPTSARPVVVKAGSMVTVVFRYDIPAGYEVQGVVELTNARNTTVARLPLYGLPAGAGMVREAKLPLSAQIPDGSYNLRVQIEGSYLWGQIRFTGSASEQGAVVVDNQPPQLGAFVPHPEEVVGNARPAITAQVSDASQVNLMVNGATIPSSAFSIAGGVLRYLPPGPLPQGRNTVTLTASDQTGNVSNPAVWSFTVDTIPPSIAVVTPAPEAVVDNPNPRITARISDATRTTCTFKVAGQEVTAQATVDGEEVSYLPVTPLPDGRITVEVTAVDAAGNQAALQWNFVVQTRLSVGSLVADTAVINASGPASVKLQADVGVSNPVTALLAAKRAGAAEWVSIEERSGIVGSYEYQLDPAMLATDGEYTLRLTIRDANGVSGTTETTILVDRTAPAFTDFRPVSDAVLEFNRATIYFGFAGADSFHIQVDGQPVDQKQVAVLEVPGGRKAVYVPAAPFETGKQHQVKVVLADAAGNIASKESRFTVLSSRRGFGFGRLWFE